MLSHEVEATRLDLLSIAKIGEIDLDMRFFLFILDSTYLTMAL